MGEKADKDTHYILWNIFRFDWHTGLFFTLVCQEAIPAYQDASFPVPNHSDTIIWIRELDPSEDGNQQTGDLSNAMSRANPGHIPA